MNKSDIKVAVIKSIQKKLLGKKLTYHEVYQLMDEIAHNRLSDILTTYFVASSFKEGFTEEELYHFTKAMVATGKRLHFKGIVADKHSIGGLPGTRATMIVVPIVIAAGFQMPKISSRAITSPAGTADVMEVLAKVEFSPSDLEDMVHTVGGCICWNGHLGIAPADDIIIRVEEPLSFESFDKIVVSIMSKHVAVGSTHLVLDLPVGKTMKIRHEEDAKKILVKFQSLGKRFGIKVVGNITHTKEPAGNGVGPALEARDVLKVLEQTTDRPMQLEQRSLQLASQLLDLCYKDARDKKDGMVEAKRILKDGTALKKFKQIVRAQGGDENITSKAVNIHANSHHVKALYKGVVTRVNNYNLSSVAKLLGAPRDRHAGIYMHKKIGDTVEKNENCLTLYSSKTYNVKEANETLKMFPIYIIE
ncbi:thymidine phosphorylase [Candidatus Roizmanbacteria bacterium]|nr:thymidine phosphorylase [Candidatus Roizmanbacteria bacterium]